MSNHCFQKQKECLSQFWQNIYLMASSLKEILGKRLKPTRSNQLMFTSKININISYSHQKVTIPVTLLLRRHFEISFLFFHQNALKVMTCALNKVILIAFCLCFVLEKIFVHCGKETRKKEENLGDILQKNFLNCRKHFLLKIFVGNFIN